MYDINIVKITIACMFTFVILFKKLKFIELSANKQTYSRFNSL